MLVSENVLHQFALLLKCMFFISSHIACGSFLSFKRHLADILLMAAYMRTVMLDLSFKKFKDR